MDSIKVSGINVYPQIVSATSESYRRLQNTVVQSNGQNLYTTVFQYRESKGNKDDLRICKIIKGRKLSMKKTEGNGKKTQADRIDRNKKCEVDRVKIVTIQKHKFKCVSCSKLNLRQSIVQLNTSRMVCWVLNGW